MIDAGPLVGLDDRTDQYHAEAVACAASIARAQLPLFVTVHTIAEAHRLLLFRRGPAAARAFLDDMYDGSVNVVPCSPEDEAVARYLLSRYHWVWLSLTDALNMAAMTRVGVAVAFTFDADYHQTGFRIIPPFEAVFPLDRA
jgi:predicted nucleic acid-binding protein